MKDFTNKTVGEIVSLNIAHAEVFKSYNIDFCCGGDVLLTDAVEKAGLSLDQVMMDLSAVASDQSLPDALNFNEWSLELLIDYIVKFHHNYIRTKGPEIYSLLDKVTNVHGETDNHLYQVRDLFKGSLVDLDNHLGKEENVLFPIVKEMLIAIENGTKLPPFHCGSVQNPIWVMNQEHDDEGDRFRKIAALTNSYQAPEHACNSYKLVLEELKQFEANLHIHIHVENNILFPKSIELENRLS